MASSKYITLEQWDNASTEQRSTWLRAGVLIRPQDMPAFRARCKREDAERREYVCQSKRWAS